MSGNYGLKRTLCFYELKTLRDIKLHPSNYDEPFRQRMRNIKTAVNIPERPTTIHVLVYIELYKFSKLWNNMTVEGII